MQYVTTFIAELSGAEKIIVSRIRNMILDSDPRISEGLSYGVPYFSHNRRICFLWPISKQPGGYPPPGPDREKVSFGFCYGNLLSNSQGLMMMEERKQVSVIKLYSPKDIDENSFREIINEAVLVDDQFAKRKKRV